MVAVVGGCFAPGFALSTHGYLLKSRGARATTVELRVTTSRLVPLPDAVADITFFPAFKGVCLARIDAHCQARYEDSPRAGRKECVRQQVPVLLLQTHQFHRVGTADFLMTALARKASSAIVSGEGNECL